MVEGGVVYGRDEVEGDEAFGCVGYVEAVGWVGGFGDSVGVFEVAGEGGGAGAVGEVAVCEGACSEARLKGPELITLDGVSLEKGKNVCTLPALLSWSLVTNTEPSPEAATLFGAGTASLHIVLTNSNFLEPRLCSNISMVEFAPTLEASKNAPASSTAGRLLTIQKRSREPESTSMSKPLRSISWPPVAER